MICRHIAFIPARKGSVGFKFKNRLFFDNTANFLNDVTWFDEVLVSSDDSEILSKAEAYGYLRHERMAELSGSEVSIKVVVKNAIEEMKIDADTYVWLFYLPILYKNIDDFEYMKSIISNNKYNSLCSFVPAGTHPFNCWSYDAESSSLKKFIRNDVFRRQDLPDAWMHYHYLCAFTAGCIDELDSELIAENTYPIFLNQETTDKLVEIDTPRDYEKWKKINSNE